MRAVVLASSLLLLLRLDVSANSCAPPALQYSCPVGSSPGDIDPTCRVGTVDGPKHIFPDNWRVLFDNYDYFFLFDFGGPWEARSYDGNHNTWRQNVGGLCGYAFRTCTVLELPSNAPVEENNWLFSQHICLQGAKEVFVNVSYTFQQCTTISRCNDAFLTLYKYEVNQDLHTHDRLDVNNYSPLFDGPEEYSRLVQPPPPAFAVEELLSFKRDQSKEGLHLGIKDTGTCGHISRMILYYTVCSAKRVGLVTYPEFPTPPYNGPDEIFTASCVCNAHNVTSLNVIASSHTGECTDAAVGGARCECNAGYKLNATGDGCEACSAGSYRALGEDATTCTSCPANTDTSAVAAPFCQCLAGYFRDDEPVKKEGPDFPCRLPPEAPVDLRVDRSDGSSIAISWTYNSSVTLDITHEVCHTNAIDFETKCVRPSITPSPNGRWRYAITGLTPDTTYFIDVQSMNGVSDQDAKNDPQRVSEVLGATTEGVPDEPTLKRLCTVVIWKPPANPNGFITTYELCFGTCPTPQECMNISSTENFLLTTAPQRQQNVDVYIRARNRLHTGPFTECSSIGCEIREDCPTAAPQETAPTQPPSTRPSRPATTPTQSATTPTQTDATPTTQPACQGPELRLNSQPIAAGSSVSMSAVGVEDKALHCYTPFEDCCKSQRKGEWYSIAQNGTLSFLPRRGDELPLYRNRGEQIVRLNVRPVADATASGNYRCCVPDSCGNDRCIDVTLV